MHLVFEGASLNYPPFSAPNKALYGISRIVQLVSEALNLIWKWRPLIPILYWQTCTAKCGTFAISPAFISTRTGDGGRSPITFAGLRDGLVANRAGDALIGGDDQSRLIRSLLSIIALHHTFNDRYIFPDGGCRRFLLFRFLIPWL